MGREQKVIYYDDEKNDEFSSAEITPKVIDENYRYIYTSTFKRFTHFFWYKIVATPIAKCYLKFKFAHKIVGGEKLRGETEGFFIYGNHTQAVADAFIPTILARPRSVYVIVHPNNVSMPVLGRITPSLGALPLPDGMGAARHFVEAVKVRISQGCPVCIYPEAHIWPYYTKIRDFSGSNFSYPVMLKKPVYCFTNTYQRWGKRRIRIVTYVDGPFYPDASLSRKNAEEALRAQTIETMQSRATNNNVEKIRYVPRGDKEKIS